ncbi:unnamed protein product [Periconia digitata]|uniref:Multicopper oxidase n=1 Tax=Periconia digitata TaxID=1303443 RepID=A0A9W4XLS7_9PLEO|nr:unnamed protein product [Periconia digitata]
MFQSLVLAGLFSALSLAKTVTYDFNIGWVSAAPDGVSRPVIGINGQWPIPTIEADEGDTIVVKATNNLGNQTTSLHFHGMYQVGTAPYDGPVGVTQCPIAPGGSFTYTFQANPAGTHWYHSHDAGQYADGLRGKMVIHDQAWESSLKVDKQIYLSMGDWYHEQIPYLLRDDYMNVNNRDGHIPIPNSFLFNESTKALDFDFEPNKRYLLRIVSLSALTCGFFHIDGQTLSVVAVDGIPVKATDTDSINICAGQTYDVVVTGHNDTQQAPEYIVKMSTDMLTGPPPPLDRMTIIGRSRGGSFNFKRDSYPSSRSLDHNWSPNAVLDDFDLVPLDGLKLLTNPTNKVHFVANQTYFPGIGTRIAIGDEPFVTPKVPALFTALTTGEAAFQASTYGPGAVPQFLKKGEVVQIYMENPQPYPHPMHLHGHTFQVAGRGSGSWDGKDSSLHAVPMRRDNVVIPPHGYLVLRFVADNPGVWYFHCHIDFHLVGGMAALFIEAPDALQSEMVVPQSAKDICAATNSPSSGNCNGQAGAISAADASTECNNVYNDKSENFGAMYVQSS